LRGVDRVRLPIHVGVFFEPEGEEGDEELGLEKEELGLDVEENGRGRAKEEGVLSPNTQKTTD